MKKIRLKEGNCKKNQKYRRKGEGIEQIMPTDKGLLAPLAIKISDIKESNYKIVLRIQKGRLTENHATKITCCKIEIYTKEIIKNCRQKGDKKKRIIDEKNQENK